MDISLLEIGAQLMTAFAIFLFTRNATPFWCFDSSALYHSLCLSSVVFPKPVYLTSASPRISHRYLDS